jgi:oligopeptide/dipeptide ABC transporter ATP-binding protein
VLSIEDLKVTYGRPHLLNQILSRPSPIVHAVQGVNLTLHRGETLGLVGESGCGKSTLARALVGLVKSSGTIRLDGHPVDWSSGEDRRRYRRAVQISFQNPDLSLNPRMAIGQIIARPLQLYGIEKGQTVTLQVKRWLERVRLPSSYIRRYPHELSGGEKQRVAVARAFAARPRVVICDEITSGLDVSVQASIINLLMELREEFGTAYVFISHDLNLVQHFADRVAVMYLGLMVEMRSSAHIYRPPYHPYTEALLSAVPAPDPGLITRRIRLVGPLPSPKNLPSGCPFHTRCPHLLGPICIQEAPPIRTITDSHWLTCHLPLSKLSSVPEVWQSATRDISPEANHIAQYGGFNGITKY